MPSYKDLLKLIREGNRPEEILRRLPMCPSRLKRILRGKRFQDALKMEEHLAVTAAIHRIASCVQGAAGRFTELLASEKDETVRKVCLALLKEGLQCASTERTKDATSAKSPGPKPGMLLKPQQDHRHGQGQPSPETTEDSRRLQTDRPRSAEGK